MSHLQLRRAQTVANANNGLWHLIPKAVDHMDHIATVIIP